MLSTKPSLSCFFEDGKLVEVQTRKADGVEMLPAINQREALKIVDAYADEIAQKWLEFFIPKMKPKIRKITKNL